MVNRNSTATLRSKASSKKLFILLLRQVKPYWKAFTVGIFFMIVLALTEAGIPALLKPVLDGTFVDKDQSYLVWAPLGIVILFSIRGASNLIKQIAFAQVSTRVVYDLRKKMFLHLLTLPTNFYDSHATGNILSKLTYDVNQVTSAGTQVITVAVKDSVTVIALIGYIFWLDWQLALFVFILLPIVSIVAIIVGRRLRIISRSLQVKFGELTHALEESLRGHKSVKIFNGQAFEFNRFEKVSNWVRRLQMKYEIAGGVSVPIVEMIGAFTMAIVLYIGTTKAGSSEFTVGSFVAFFTALGLLISPIKRLTKINDPLQRGLAAAESIFGLLEVPSEENSGNKEWNNSNSEIKFDKVSFRYPNAKENALNDISIKIDSGSTVALVGASGGGKSTLANLIPRLYNPSTGKILIDGIDVQDFSLESLRENIALVSQDVILFNGDVTSNIAYGLTPSPKQSEIEKAARDAYAHDFIQQLPEKYDSLIGENGIRLSGGQRQRIAIARALLKNSRILILDEATSALDTQSERYVKAALEKLRIGRTTFIIAHRLSTVEAADLILVIEQGTIIEKGTHSELLEKGGIYHNLYQTGLNEEL
tara:strand:- start:3025 stop:4800 length:1776 start_codon:yes stop_codon:yes gene_type:complete